MLNQQYHNVPVNTIGDNSYREQENVLDGNINLKTAGWKSWLERLGSLFVAVLRKWSERQLFQLPYMGLKT